MIKIPTFSNQIKICHYNGHLLFRVVFLSIRPSILLFFSVQLLSFCMFLIDCTGCERCSDVYNVYPSNNILHYQPVFCRLHASNRFRCSFPLGQLLQYEVDRVYYRNNEIHCVKSSTWTKQHSSCYVYPQH